MKLLDILKRKEKNNEPENNSPELLAVKLFFIEKPILIDEEIINSLNKRFDNIEFPKLNSPESKSKQYFFNDYQVNYNGNKLPAQAAILIPDKNGIELNKLEASFQQSWSWREAESVVRQCNYEILLTDFMSKGLDYKLRLEYFQKFVSSVVETIKPNAIWISNGEKIMNNENYLKSFSTNDYQNLNGFMNVRLFNIQTSNGEMLMDTLGLHSLGLPDFEIRFRDYDPPTIAGLLFDYGSYIFNKGVVIDNGNTIQGVEKNQKWKCYFKESMVDPKRIIIEIKNGG